MPDFPIVPSSRHYALNDARDAGYRVLERYDAEQALDDRADGAPRRRPDAGAPPNARTTGFQLAPRGD